MDHALFSGFACAQILVSWLRKVIESSFLAQKNRNCHVYIRLVKGAGVGVGVDDPGKVKIDFFVVPVRGKCQLPDAFYQIKKYCS